MKLILFELKKIYRQKRLLWLVLIVSLCMGGLLWQNVSEQPLKQERALEMIEPFVSENIGIQIQIRLMSEEESLTEAEDIQLEYTYEIANILVHWRRAIDQEDWQAIPHIEKEFLETLELFEEAGGQFQALQGIDRDKAIAKNEWLINYDLAYADEAFPLSPVLFLKQNTDLFLSIAGLALLVLFFAHTMTIEKEQRTLSTLKTQPMSNRKLFVGKYISLVIIMMVYIMGIGLALIVSWIVGERTFLFQYPQIVSTGETFTIISSLQYVLRSVLFFSCAGLIVFSCALFLSKWIQHTFTMFMSLAFVMFLGYMMTDMNDQLQSPFNPFQYIRISHMTSEVPQLTDWLYPICAILFSAIILTFAIYGRESHWGFQFNRLLKPFKKGQTLTHQRPAFKMSTFEWRKMRRHNMFKYTCIALLFFIIVTYYVLSQQTMQQQQVYKDALHEVIEQSEFIKEVAHTSIDTYKELIQEAEDSGEDKEAVYMESIEESKKAIAFADKIKQQAEHALVGMESGEWDLVYSYQLLDNRWANEELESGSFVKGIKDNFGTFTVEVSIAEKEWLMAHQIQPIYSGEYIQTLYDEKGFDESLQQFKEDWEAHNEKIDNSGLYTLYHFYDDYVYVIPMVLLLVLLGGGLATERGKEPTLQLLKTQPMSFKKIYMGKIIQSMSVATMSGLAFVTVIVVIASLMNRLGDWNYPILYYDHEQIVNLSNYAGTISEGKGFHFVPLGEIVWQSVVLLVLCLLFIIAISLVLSIFLNNKFSVMTLTILICVGGYMLGSHVLTDLAHLIPFTYLNISQVTNGSLTILLDNPNIQFWMGPVTLLSSILILIGLGYGMLFVRRH